MKTLKQQVLELVEENNLLIEENNLLRLVLKKCPICRCGAYPFSKKERLKYKKCLKCEVLGKGV